MKYTLLFIVGVACVLSSCHAQPSSNKNTEILLSKITPLSIGDTVPDITIKNIISYPKKEIKLYDLKGKLVILDFFATWCSSCIAALPKLDTLQQLFADKIQIFVVDDEPAEKVSSFLYHNPIGKNISLPFIESDSILSKFFPHKLIPHEVWITPKGLLLATTSSDQLTQSNLKNLLAGKDIHFRMKNDIMDINLQKPLFFNKKIKVDRRNLKYYSIFSGYIEGIPSSTFVKRDTNKLVRRICFTNVPIKQLYQFAFNNHFHNNRWIIDVKKPSEIVFKGDEYAAWAVQHAYSYELLTPPAKIKRVRRKMKNDLINYFGYKAGIEKRKIKCFVMTANENAKNSISPGGKSGHNFINNNKPKFITNQPISELVKYLDHTLPIPVIDETSLTQPIDLELPDNILNIDSLKIALYQYGFDIKEINRITNVFVISDKEIKNAQHTDSD